MLSDINNDRAVDLVVTGATAVRRRFTSTSAKGRSRRCRFIRRAGLAPTIGVYVFDFNKDGWMDVALTHAGAPGISLWRNVDGKQFERVPLPITDATHGWGITAIDFDNDGWIDLAAVVETAKGTEAARVSQQGRARI